MGNDPCWWCGKVPPPRMKHRALASGRCEVVSIARCASCGHESELIARRERLRLLLELMNRARMRRAYGYREAGEPHFAAKEWARWQPRVRAVRDALGVLPDGE